MIDDPHDEWQVVNVRGRLCRVAVEDRNWLHSTEAQVISWRRIDEDESGDTFYRCVVLYPLEYG